MDDIAVRLVEALYAGSPAPLGCRVNHARGLLVEGRFRAVEAAQRLSAAALFDSIERPLVARFSSFSGDPHIGQDDPKATPCGLALEIDGKDGMVLVGHSAAGFPAGDPDRFLAFVEAQNAKAKDAEGLRREATERAAPDGPPPNSPTQPQSFAALRYHMLHAFVLTDGAGRQSVGRLVVQPSDGEETPPVFSGPNRLDEELRDRLERGSATMMLAFVPAREGDPIRDIAAHWPGEHVPMVLGRLLFDRIAADQHRQRSLVFDPSRLPRGVGFAGDPMVEPRMRAYRLAAERRTGRSD